MRKQRLDRRRAARPRPIILILLAFVSLFAVASWRSSFIPANRPVDESSPVEFVEFPKPHLVSATAVAASDFAGDAACTDCHQDQFAKWQGSTHGRAGGRPGSVHMIAPFNGAPIVFADARVLPITQNGGGHAFVVHWLNRPAETLRIDAVVGGGHLAGGGTQGLFTRVADGTLRFLPFDYSRHDGQWFCRMKADGRWLPITPEMQLAECSDWPPHRTLGSVENNPGCDQCHGSQISTRFDTARKQWMTEFSSLTINCESCHGAAQRHVTLARSGRMGQSADIGLRALATLDKGASVAVCLQCHGEKLALGSPGGIVTPENFESLYSVSLPMLTDPPYTADFRHRKFGYQGPHLASVCFLDGSMSCTDCHDPHSQTYRDPQWRSLPGRLDDGQCVSCHPSKGGQGAEHTFHAPGSPGSRCVACHMPYLQNPGIGNSIRYARADHVIPIPRPGEDEAQGVKSACASCHGDRSSGELAQQVKRWWGELKPRPPLVEAMLRPPGDSPSQAAAALLRPDLKAPAPQFAALSQYLRRYIRPDGGLASPYAGTAIRRLALSPDSDLSALSLAALHLGDGTGTATRKALAAALAADASGRVRARWKVILEYLGLMYQTEGDVAAAVRAYRKALELAPGDAAVLEQLGGALGQAGDMAGATAAIETAVKAEPERVPTIMLRGLLMEQAGDISGALGLYVRAAELNPWSVAVYSRLASARLQLKDVAGARVALERLVALDPSNAGAQVSLARILAAQGERASALRRVDEALAYDPNAREAAAFRDMLIAR